LNLKQLLVRIRGMKDREGLRAIINAAEARDSLLSNIDGKIRRREMWAKVEKLGLKKGDMVFIHVPPIKGINEKKHQNLWGRSLTVLAVKPRNKEIVVQITGLGQTTLSPFECVSMKLSTTPTAEALAGAFKRTITHMKPGIDPAWLHTPGGKKFLRELKRHK
jgi:hypothetical protein